MPAIDTEFGLGWMPPAAPRTPPQSNLRGGPTNLPKMSHYLCFPRDCLPVRRMLPAWHRARERAQTAAGQGRRLPRDVLVDLWRGRIARSHAHLLIRPGLFDHAARRGRPLGHRPGNARPAAWRLDTAAEAVQRPIDVARGTRSHQHQQHQRRSDASGPARRGGAASTCVDRLRPPQSAGFVRARFHLWLRLRQRASCRAAAVPPQQDQ
jgi:hypothetical protein